MRLTHTRMPGVQSVTTLSTSHGTHIYRIYHRNLTWPVLVQCGNKSLLWLVSLISQEWYEHAAGPWGKIKEMHASTKKPPKNQAAALRSTRKPLIVSPEYVTQWLRMIFLVLWLQLNQHSLLIWWHTLLHNMGFWVDCGVLLVRTLTPSFTFVTNSDILSKNGINNQERRYVMGLKFERQWPIQCVSIRLMEDTPT